jgi:hypothetical protein
MVVSTRPDLDTWGTTVHGSDPLIDLVTLRCRARRRDSHGQMRYCGHPFMDADLGRPSIAGLACERCGAQIVVFVIEAKS